MGFIVVPSDYSRKLHQTLKHLHSGFTGTDMTHRVRQIRRERQNEFLGVIFLGKHLNVE